MKKGVIAVLSTACGVIAAMGVIGKNMQVKTAEIKNTSDKHLALFLMMDQWVKVKQAGKNLSEYFKNNGYFKIAIYGMSYAGKTLVNELKNTEIEIAYGIDKNADSIFSDIEIHSLEDNLDAVDAVVVTAITFFDEIEQNLSEKLGCPIISLEDILYEMMEH